jgi:tight adherence protein B
VESSQLVSIAAALFVFMAVGLIFFGVQASRARASSPEMEDRLDRYGNIAETATAESSGGAASMVSERLERATKGTSFAETTGTALARADLRMTVGEFIAIRGAAAVAGFALGMLVGGMQIGLSFLFGIVFGVVGWMIPPTYLKIRAGRRQQKFVGQLGDTIGLMANSLRAGYSLLQTMELISRESPAPMSDEFRRVVREVGLGISPQQALNNLLRRVPSEDLDLMVSAINIQHEIGGNLGQILDIIGDTIRERVRIKGEINVLVSQQKFSGNIITAMPVALAGGLYLVNKDYVMGMFVWPWVCLPIGASVLLVIGYMVMRKIVAINI